MIVRKILTSDINIMLDFMEIYCIRKGFSFVRVENEIHFDNYILRFFLFNDKQNIHDSLIMNLSNDLKIEEDTSSLKNKSDVFSMKKGKSKINLGNNCKVNTKGYYSRIRRRR